MKSFSLIALSLCFAFFTTLRSQERIGMDPKESIITNTEKSVNHRTLLSAVKAADLEKVLDSDGPFTVFAPSDNAFDKLSNARIDALMQPENKEQLHALLTYHIVAGNFSASHILKAMCRGNGKATFTTVQGEELTATMEGIDIILTDCNGNTAKIIAADANQRNGVIHEIDSVILPGKI